MLQFFLALPVIVAFPSFREQLPNGHRVACPEGQVGNGCTAEEGQPSSVCNGLGHATCAGATMPLNPFGMDMAINNHTWTRELCEADSDADGMTNGEELGDPCCLWEAYDTPSDYTLKFAATHPGVANKMSNYVRPECSITASKTKADKFNQFNAWEEQRTAEMFIDNFKIPSDRTTYVDIAMNFPDDSEDLFHAVSAQIILKNKKNLHHFVIRGCPEKWPAEKVGKAVSMQEGIRCMEMFGGWAPGKDILATPSWLGFPIGRAAGIVAFVVNVHYDNPEEETGRVSNDGIRLFYTPTLRKDSINGLIVMRVSRNPQMFVAPGKKRFFLTRACSLNVTDPDGQPAVLNLASMAYHAHLLGTEMWSEYAPAGSSGPSVDLGSEKIWHFDDQYINNILDMDIQLQTGDHIQSTCVFDSTSRQQYTRFGAETTDEMCFAAYNGWPGNVTASCSGHLWTGELEPDESGLGLATRHPEIDAPNAFDGSSLSTGGWMIHGEIPDVCYDDYRVQKLCPIIIREVTKNNASCDHDAGTAIMQMMRGSASGLWDNLELWQGSTLLNLCCSQACRSLCPDHELCNPDSTTSTTGIPSTTGRPALSLTIMALLGLIFAR